MKNDKKDIKELTDKIRYLEEKLSESENKYRFITKNVIDVIWEFDFKKDRFTYLSPSFIYWRGVSPEIWLRDQVPLAKNFPKGVWDRQTKSMANLDDPNPEKRGTIIVKDREYMISTHKEYDRNNKQIWVEITERIIRDEKGKASKIVGVSRNVTRRKKAEEALKKAHEELESKVRERTAELNEANISLKVLIQKMGEERITIEEKIMLNFRELVGPSLEKLKSSRLAPSQQATLKVLESNINNIISPFIKNLSTISVKLTPLENQVASYLRENMQTKEIAELMCVSVKAIEFHRYNIRKKLGLTNRKTNLRTYLQSFKESSFDV